MYSSYLQFFDQQISRYGTHPTLQRFFYHSPLANSIGSQRLPTVHLALGIKYALPQVIGQGLSFIATSYQDSNFLRATNVSDSHGALTAYEILVDQVHVDPRFEPFSVSLQQSIKVRYEKMLKSTQELLRNYVYLWKMPQNSNDALHELCVLAAHLVLTLGNGEQDNLIKTIQAMKILYQKDTCPLELVRVQFLNVICWYILQGRPKIKLEHEFQSWTMKKMIGMDANTISVRCALEEANDMISFSN